MTKKILFIVVLSIFSGFFFVGCDSEIVIQTDDSVKESIKIHYVLETSESMQPYLRESGFKETNADLISFFHSLERKTILDSISSKTILVDTLLNKYSWK